MKFISVHIFIHICIKSKTNSNNSIPAGMVTVNIFFFAHWLKEIDIERYGNDLQILPVTNSTEVYKYSDAMLKHMPIKALKTFEDILLYSKNILSYFRKQYRSKTKQW